MSYTRRRFLHRALRAGAALAVGCGPVRGDGRDFDNIVESQDTPAGGELVRLLRFERVPFLPMILVCLTQHLD